MERGSQNGAEGAAHSAEDQDKSHNISLNSNKKPSRDMGPDESYFESFASKTNANDETKQANSKSTSRMNTNQSRSLNKSPLLLRRPSKSFFSASEEGRTDMSRSVDSLTKRSEYQQTAMQTAASERAK